MKLCSSLTSCFIFLAALFAGNLCAYQQKSKSKAQPVIIKTATGIKGINAKAISDTNAAAWSYERNRKQQQVHTKGMKSENIHLLEGE